MLALAFDFPARRYHATPWGRHVNEADVAWPPDPWRIARALLFTWHRKVAREEVPREALRSLLEALAGQLPSYDLPPAVHAHTRHFMPAREGRSEKNTLVFDAFARFGSNARLVAVWEQLRLAPEEEHTLDVLLGRMSYLGRAESWVEARRVPDWRGTANCRPGNEELDAGTGELRDVVSVFAPRLPGDYAELRSRTLSEAKGRRLGRKAMNELLATLPDDWLASLEIESGDLRAAGWSAPPAAREVHYTRPATALEPVALPRIIRRRPSERRPKVARYAVHGNPLCRLEDAVRFGELLRRALMGRAKRTLGEDRIPPVLSGHGTSDHSHAFFLPDAQQVASGSAGGRVDHALVFAQAGFDRDTIEVLDRLRVVEADGMSWQLVLEGIGERDAFRSPLLATATDWISVTPYLHPWHRKARFDVADQIRRECRERGLPELTALAPVAEVLVGGRPRRPIHFHRFRAKRGLSQPDRNGSFWRLRFAEAVHGPVALGFGCHFGLGLFTPAR